MKSNPINSRSAALAGCIAALLASPAFAADDTDLLLDVRWRHEMVSADSAPEDASASTLRTRLGVSHEFSDSWSGLLEFEDVRQAGASDYNDTVNGAAQYPVVADPADTELNRLQLDWKGNAGKATLGRQRINLGSQRYIGAVGFRQNEQTFDAARGMFTPGDSTLDVIYLARANRIFGAHHPTNANTELDGVVIDYSVPIDDVTVGFYAQAFEFTDQPAQSHRNLGLRGEWTPGNWSVTAEFAQQDEYADAVRSDAVEYRQLRVGRKHDDFRWAVAQEVLGGNGVDAFQTPFATLHKFNGWADIFLTTPAGGLDDRWVELGSQLGVVDIDLRWHVFAADTGGTDYGDELDIAVRHTLDNGVKLGLEYADFSSDSGTADVTRVWFTVAWIFASD